MHTDDDAVLIDTQIDDSLFDLVIEWLRKVDRREFYHRAVDLCAALLQSEVCALYVKTTKVDGVPRVCLVAGKLPPGHPKGRRMDPREVGTEPIHHSYRIISEREVTSGMSYDGVTGRIASTGQSVTFNSYPEITSIAGHAGRWDAYVWCGKQAERFRGMLGVAIRNDANEIIGVIKVENKINSSLTDKDERLLTRIGQSLASSLDELIREQRELSPEIVEHEYRVPRSRPEAFERKKTGEVVLRHSMTAICQSDIYYFWHHKPRTKLDERLPLVLGHETTAEVFQVVGENKYANGLGKGELIQPKDKVVVIPLIPCGTCEVCRNGYGENYCPSSKFMASNAPGSLRTVYKYFPELILKVPDESLERYALFTEPMSNIVQMLNELGFCEGQDKAELVVAPFRRQDFNYFHMSGDSFTNVFDSITAEEPFPRTVFTLNNPGANKIGSQRISHNNLMRKGLGLLGCGNDSTDYQVPRTIYQPKILILGGGTMGFLLALVLHAVFKIPDSRIVVTGRTASKLTKFHGIARPHSIKSHLESDNSYDATLAEEAVATYGDEGRYDFVFECVGWPAVGQNIDLAMRVLKPGGVVALEGLAEQHIQLNFDTLVCQQLFLKGFYRSSIAAYAQSLRYIVEYPEIRAYLEKLIDCETEINGRRSFHRVEAESDLERIFQLATSKSAFGRLIVSELA